MLRFFRKVRGSVSLILILIMLPMMTYATMIVDGTRVMSAKTAVSGAGDLTMNTALSTYDAALKDAYGLFAMCDNLNDLETTFSAYFSNTMAGTLTDLGVPENDPVREYINQMTDTVTGQLLGTGSVDPNELVNHLAMDVSSLQVTGNSSSTLGNPAVMKRQIVEYMKYKAPIMFAADIMDKLEMFKGAQEQTDAIGAQIDYTKSCDSLQEACENAKNSIYAYNDAVIKLDEIAGSAAASYFDTKVGNAGSTGTVYADLQSATENLIYFKNLYTFWDTSQKVYIADIDTTVNGGVNYAKETFSYYELAKDSDGTYSKRFTIRANTKNTTAITDSSSNDVLDILNEKVTNLENTAQEVLVKDSSLNGKHLENTIALKANYEEVLADVNSKRSQFSQVYQDLNDVLAKSDPIEYITAYYQFLGKHNFQELGQLSAIYQQWTGNARSYFQAEKDMVDFLNANINVWAENVTVDASQKITLENVDENALSYGDRQRYRLVCAYLKLLQDVCGCTLSVTLNGSNVVLDIDENETKDQYEDLINNHYSYDLYQKLSEVINKCVSKRDEYLNTAKTQFGNANDKISEYVGQLKTVKEKIGTVCTDMDNVLKYAKEVHTSLDTWDDEIKKTPDGGTKDTMQATHDAEENKIVLDEVEALKTFAYNQKKVYEDYFNYIDSITYFGEKAVSNGQLNAETFVANSVTGGKWRTESTYNAATQMDLTKSKDASGMASDCMKNYFQQNGKAVTATPDDVKNAVQRNGGAYFIQFGFVQAALNTTSTNGVTRNDNYFYTAYFPGDANQKAKTFYEKLINITTKLGGSSDVQAAKNDYKNQLNGGGDTSKMSDQQKENAEASKHNDTNKDSASSNPIQTDSNGGTRTKETNAKDNGDASLLNAALDQFGKRIDGSLDSKYADTKSGNANDLDGVTSGDTEDSKKTNKDNAEDQKNNLKAASEFMTQITDVINKGISLAYVEEYMTNMFSCYTTDLTEDGDILPDAERETTLEGNLLCNNYHYMYEQEYIIWGGTPSSAVATTMGVIYGIRFVMNTIYAFTSAEVQAIALEIATAIAGWTVFGIPIVQAIVTIIMSLAESGIDLYELSRGASVPIFKSSSTWRCSISGIANYAVEKGIEYAGDKAEEFLTNLSNDIIDGGVENVEKFLSEQANGVADNVKASLNSAINSTISSFYAKSGLDKLIENVNGTSTELKAEIDASIDMLIQTVNQSETPDAIKQAEISGLNKAKESVVNAVYQEIKNTGEQLSAQNVISVIQKAVNKGIDNITEEIISAASDMIENCAGELRTAVNEGVSSGIDEATNKLTDAAKEKINNSLEKFTKSSSSTSVDPKDSGSALKLNYKQYVKIFTLVGLMANEDAMLQRCAALIQVNMNQNTVLQTTGKKDYNLGTAYTLVEIDATVELNTIFSYEANVNGQTEVEDDGLYSGLSTLWNNPGKSQLHYHSVMGY